MKELLIHVGPHKTGSTAIQRALGSLSNALDAIGWRFETFPDLEDGGAHRLADTLAADRFPAAKPYLRALARSDRSVILSSENFSRMTNKHVRHFAKAIEAERVRVVYYLRNPLFRLQSAWRERVKHGYRFSFVEFVAGRLIDPLQDREINDVLKIQPWSNTFGDDSVHIPLYDPIDDVALHFIRTYFPTMLALAEIPEEPVNKSMDMVRIEIYRALCGHQIHIPRQIQYKPQINALYKRMCEVVDAGNYARTLDFSLDTQAVRTVERRVASKYRKQLDPKPMGDVIFTDRRVSWEYIAPEIWLENRELTEQLFDIKSQMAKECGTPALDRRLAPL